MFLTTYVNDVDPQPPSSTVSWSTLDSVPLPLDGTSALQSTTAVPFRGDLRVPLITVPPETDLLDGHVLRLSPGQEARRQNDFRASKMPGCTAHANQLHDPGSASSTPVAASLHDIVAAFTRRPTS